MKIKYTFLIFALAIVYLTNSCKKCVECSYKDPATMVTRSREECGKRETIDHFKQDVFKEAKAFGLEEADVTCKEK